jgi:hypothetical protein
MLCRAASFCGAGNATAMDTTRASSGRKRDNIMDGSRPGVVCRDCRGGSAAGGRRQERSPKPRRPLWTASYMQPTICNSSASEDKGYHIRASGTSTEMKAVKHVRSTNWRG